MLSPVYQLSEEVNLLEAKSDTARNNYLLDLASSNAHLNEYRTSHLPDLIQVPFEAIFCFIFYLDLYKSSAISL